MTKDTKGTLNPNEAHPCAQVALDFIKDHIKHDDSLNAHIEALASCAISGNRIAEICGETLRRLLEKEPVSDRYIMGLAWYFWKHEVLLWEKNKDKESEF